MRIKTDPQDWQGGTRGQGRSGRGLGQENDVWALVSRITDRLTQGRKAVPATEGLIAAGIVENPDQMRQVTEQNEEVLNEYFSHLDLQALARRLNTEEKMQSAAIEAGKSVALVAFGAAAVKGIEYLRNSNS